MGTTILPPCQRQILPPCNRPSTLCLARTTPPGAYQKYSVNPQMAYHLVGYNIKLVNLVKLSEIKDFDKLDMYILKAGYKNGYS